MFDGISTVLLIILIIVATVLLVIKISYNAPKQNTDDSSQSNSLNGNPEIIEAQSTNSIAIPGFDKMQMIARQKEQIVNLYNPSRNNCYFELTILLSTGEELFHSGLLAPRKTITEIKLNHTLESGVYEGAILRYSCYSIGDMSELNGANITFDLEVIQ